MKDTAIETKELKKCLLCYASSLISGKVFLFLMGSGRVVAAHGFMARSIVLVDLFRRIDLYYGSCQIDMTPYESGRSIVLFHWVF